MLTGISLRIVVELFTDIDYQFLDTLVPVLGTIGLIMIVLEEALELQISRKKVPILLKGLITSIVLLLVNIWLLTWIFQESFKYDFKSAVMYSIPLSVLSSAVAIPSASGLLKIDREFVVYETTFSDIIGIALFYYAIDNFSTGKDPLAVGQVVNQLGLIFIVVLISVAITALLMVVLKQIRHPTKFFFVIAILLGIYAIGKRMHWPVLLTIFIFGLMQANVENFLPSSFRKRVDIKDYEEEIGDFKVLTVGISFLVRIFFFLFFGFSILYSDFEPSSFYIGIGLFMVMFVPRYLYFVFGKMLLFFRRTLQLLRPRFSLRPSTVLFIAPRGLISILLFVEIDSIDSFEIDKENVVNEQLLLILILTSMVFMLLGTMRKIKPEGPEFEDLHFSDNTATEQPFDIQTQYPSEEDFIDESQPLVEQNPFSEEESDVEDFNDDNADNDHDEPQDFQSPKE